MEREVSFYFAIIRNLLLLTFLVFLVLVCQQIVENRHHARLEKAKISEIRQLANLDNPQLAALLAGKMVLIPAGEFWMGSDHGRSDEKPLHQVYLDSYWIDQFEVTNLQYQTFLMESGHTPPQYWHDTTYPDGQADFPVVGVSWKEAAAYCSWAGKRLPTEAEWEKACRGTGTALYPWGNQWQDEAANVGEPLAEVGPDVWDQAWSYLQVSFPKTAEPALEPIGSYPDGVSPWGIYDLVGNASEWVADYYNWDGYWDVPDQNPWVKKPRWNHCVRGSAWWMPVATTVEGHDLNRCSARSSSHGDVRDARMGFRCACSVSECQK